MYYEISNQPLNGVRTYSGGTNVPKEDGPANIDMTVKKKGDPKKPPRVYAFQLGAREGNTRIIGPDSVSSEISSIMLHGGRINGLSAIIPNRNNPSAHPSSSNGSVDASRQGQRGDCFFLAEINAIRNTNGGKKILDANLKKRNGTVTVTLPGAVKIRQEYASKGLPCEVTGTYSITQDALAKAEKLAGKSFSKDDMDVICLEIAMESFRAEMVKTNKLNKGKVPTGSYTAESSVGHLTSRDYMYGGMTYDAGFILTGEKSDVYHNPKKYEYVQRYSDGQYGYITKEQMLQQTTFSRIGAHAKGISEINHLGKEEKDLYNMLDKYQGHESEYALTCGVRVSKNGPDGATKKDSGHALTIVKITDDTVYVANPWHPDKIEPIPRTEFVKMVSTMSAMQVKSTQTTQNGHNSHQVLNLMLGKLNSHNTGIKPPKKVNTNNLNNLIGNFNRNNNERKIDVTVFTRIINKASTTELSDKEKLRLNALLHSISDENTDNQFDLNDLKYFYNKFIGNGNT